MGCGNSQPPPPPTRPPPRPAGGGGPKPQSVERPQDPNESAISTSIDKNIERIRQQEELKVKLLLLGAGESGKSTIFKQMRILYGAPRTEDDQRMYGVIVRSNVIVAIKKLCKHLTNLGLEEQLAGDPLEKDDFGVGLTPKECFDIIVAHTAETAEEELEIVQNGDGPDWIGQSPRAGLQANKDAKLFLQLWRHIKILWESNTMKEVWTRRAAANVIDGHKEYMQDITRIASTGFRPTTQDILLARVKTTQVVMERYRIDGIEFEMYDVGGQRSERRKWIDCFDEVDAVVFVAALSEYDQVLAEAKRTNRMMEALDLFRGICNNRAFAKTSIMLFLNKKDVFADKINYTNIADQAPFSDYAGPPGDFNEGVMYFINKFKGCMINEEFNDSFIHVTCATDTNNMEFVLDATRTIIMTDNLKRSGFLGSG